MNTEPVRPVSRELRLIKRSIQRLKQHPDSTGALRALRVIREELEYCIGETDPPPFVISNYDGPSPVSSVRTLEKTP